MKTNETICDCAEPVLRGNSGYEARVIDSRAREQGHVIWRRRVCGHCGGRFTTYERVEQIRLAEISKLIAEVDECRMLLMRNADQLGRLRPALRR
jgi:transcriptional regulator NrdR family protein